jgi:hypothetical protein
LRLYTDGHLVFPPRDQPLRESRIAPLKVAINQPQQQHRPCVTREGCAALPARTAVRCCIAGHFEPATLVYLLIAYRNVLPGGKGA